MKLQTLGDYSEEDISLYFASCESILPYTSIKGEKRLAVIKEASGSTVTHTTVYKSFSDTTKTQYQRKKEDFSFDGQVSSKTVMLSGGIPVLICPTGLRTVAKGFNRKSLSFTKLCGGSSELTTKEQYEAIWHYYYSNQHYLPPSTLGKMSRFIINDGITVIDDSKVVLFGIKTVTVKNLSELIDICSRMGYNYE